MLKRTCVVSVAFLYSGRGFLWSKTGFTRTLPRTYPRKCGRPKQLISPIKNYVCDDYIFEFENDYIFVFANEVNEKTTIELDDVLEENYMTVYVKTINGKTIRIEKYENRSDEPRGAHGDQSQGKAVIQDSKAKHPNRRSYNF